MALVFAAPFALAACSSDGNSMLPQQTRNAASATVTGSRHASETEGSCASSGTCNPNGPGQADTCTTDGGGGDGGGDGGGGGGSSGGGSTGVLPPAPTPSIPPVTQVACTGTPTQCSGIPCSGSPESIGDFINNPKNNSSIQITDINSLWETAGNASYVWGWLYQAGGSDYIQINYANKANWSVGFSASLSSLFGVSVSAGPPGGYGGITLWNGSLPPGAFPKKYESKGATLV